MRPTKGGELGSAFGWEQSLRRGCAQSQASASPPRRRKLEMDNTELEALKETIRGLREVVHEQDALIASFSYQCRLKGARLDSLLRVQEQQSEAMAQERASARGREEALKLRCHQLGRQVRSRRISLEAAAMRVLLPRRVAHPVRSLRFRCE